VLGPERACDAADDAAPATSPTTSDPDPETEMQSASIATPHTPPAATLVLPATPRQKRQAPLLRANIQHHWVLDPSLTFLNHAQYGACTKGVLRAQSEIRERIERDPVRFLKVDLEPLMDGVREKVAAFVHCNPADLLLLRNATHGLCTIFRTTKWTPGDEILITDHDYACVPNELERLSRESGVVVVRAPVPFPVTSPQQIVQHVLERVTRRTRLVCLSHITSASSLILPAAAVIRELNAAGIDSLLDGAHSPGQIPVDIRALQPTYFVGSGHKWMSGPKGSAFVYVRPDKQAEFRPLALTARAHKIRPERAQFLRDFDYQGTDDYSPMLTLPAAIESMGGLLPGGWPALMRHNHDLAMAARDVFCEVLGCEAPAPESMTGGMFTLLIPDPPAHLMNRPTCYDDALQDVLFDRYRIVAPVWHLASTNQRVVRVSAQVYNTAEQYERAAHALKTELDNEQR
jgi:isopenicillin-N epimerase